LALIARFIEFGMGVWAQVGVVLTVAVLVGVADGVGKVIGLF
jgi:hypothetical protein